MGTGAHPSMANNSNEIKINETKDTILSSDSEKISDRDEVFTFPALDRKVERIKYGIHLIKPLFKSALRTTDGTLYICSKCISIHPTERSLSLHEDTCRIPFIPIYSEGGDNSINKEDSNAVNYNNTKRNSVNDPKYKTFVAISKISSLEKKQLLAQIAMMFIKRKTVFYEIAHYDFFVLVGEEVMGYFSRNRNGINSLSCLFVWPCFQKQGYGSLLMDYSQIKKHQACIEEESMNIDMDDKYVNMNINEYKDIDDKDVNTNMDDKYVHMNIDDKDVNMNIDTNDKYVHMNENSPERPLSKKAIFSYRKYWKYKVIGASTVREAAANANISIDDAVVGLELNGFNFREWRHEGEIEIKKPRLLLKSVVKK
ncbi:hypothetical protein ENBRE01_1507 [Enteropsectra breve]|nr:hypothetical protein ENBRE01_1507 [Enteropsectra breve]